MEIVIYPFSTLILFIHYGKDHQKILAEFSGHDGDYIKYADHLSKEGLMSEEITQIVFLFSSERHIALSRFRIPATECPNKFLCPVMIRMLLQNSLSGTFTHCFTFIIRVEEILINRQNLSFIICH